MEGIRGSSPSKASAAAAAAAAHASPEQLLDSFKAAALSVTKLYKTSAAAQTKARADGYQDCLDDLLQYLDRNNAGLSDGEGWIIRKWATERLDGREPPAPNPLDSDDEVDKPEPASSPDAPAAASASASIAGPASQAPSAPEPPAATSSRDDSDMRNASSPPVACVPSFAPEDPEPICLPAQDSFCFKPAAAAPSYPQDSYPNLASLDLSDSTKPPENPHMPVSHTSRSRSLKRYPGRSRASPAAAATAQPFKGAGQKRSINFAELFDVGGLNFGKEFGRDGKRPRHS